MNDNLKDRGDWDVLPEVMGMPPAEELSNLRHYAMPVVEITPCVPDFTRGSSLFRAKNAFDNPVGKTPAYTDLLEQHGFTTNEKCLKYAFLADSFPTDNFGNEYGESVLDKLTGTVSSASADISQIFGARSITEANKMIGKAGADSNSTVGSMISGLSNMADSGMNVLKSFSNTADKSGTLTSFGSMAGDVLAGGRIDFPTLWKGSSFKPSYSLTVRLFNPNPGSENATNKYIIGPIASLLLLAIPISDNGVTYNWPYIHKIRCRGIYNLQTAFISNVTVIKGGDQHQVGFNQRLGIVDVRLDFGSLFNSMIAMNNASNEDRPTLQSYLDELKEEKPDVGEALSDEKYKRSPGYDKWLGYTYTGIAAIRSSQRVKDITEGNLLKGIAIDTYDAIRGLF
jgi:hypothetical protein